MALDADFVVSAGLHEKLSASDASAALLEDVSIQRNVVVLPAFETESSLGLEKGGEIANLAQQGEYHEKGYSATCMKELLDPTRYILSGIPGRVMPLRRVCTVYNGLKIHIIMPSLHLSLLLSILSRPHITRLRKIWTEEGSSA